MPERREIDVVSDEHRFGGDDPRDALQEVSRGAIVDGHGDGALEQAAPEGDDPFGPVFGPEDDGVAFANPGPGEPGSEGLAARATSA